MTAEDIANKQQAYLLKAFEVDNHKLQAIQLMSEATSLISSKKDTHINNDNERAGALMEHAIIQFKTAQQKAQEAGKLLKEWEQAKRKGRVNL